MTKKSPPASSQRDRKKKRKVRLTQKAWILIAACSAALCVLLAWLLKPRPSMTEKMSLTTLDSLTIADLHKMPQSSYEEKTQVKDFSFYGDSLVLYDRPYEPLESDGYFGRNIMLKNIATGEELTWTFSGGADTGLSLQDVPVGVYEIYLADGYAFKRAYMDEFYRSEPYYTIRNDKKVNSIELSANNVFLDKFGIESDENYLYLTVTESLPIARVSDVVIDPSGYLLDSNGTAQEWYSADGFDEAEQSERLAHLVASYLEGAGLKVTFSRTDQTWSGYAGVGSRTETAYDSQAKIFLNLTMSDSQASRPFFISSPFTNGRLGNAISSALTQNGIELYTPVSVTQLNAGNSYDQLAVKEDGSLLPFSLQPALRETGGYVTSAGQYSGWGANSAYSKARGMNALIFCYASGQNPESIEYFKEHEETIARSIAQGILNLNSVEITLSESMKVPVDNSPAENSEQMPSVDESAQHYIVDDEGSLEIDPSSESVYEEPVGLD